MTRDGRPGSQAADVHLVDRRAHVEGARVEQLEHRLTGHHRLPDLDVALGDDATERSGEAQPVERIRRQAGRGPRLLEARPRGLESGRRGLMTRARLVHLPGRRQSLSEQLLDPPEVALGERGRGLGGLDRGARGLILAAGEVELAARDDRVELQEQFTAAHV